MDSDKRGLVSIRAMEIAVGLLVFGFGAMLIVDALRLGNGWASDGPQAGYFPFYIGVILCGATAGTMLAALRKSAPVTDFVERGQFKLVLAILLPTTAYVLVAAAVGIYASSALFIGGFMAWKGGYKPLKCAAVGLGVTVALFLMFEVWFQVPLPKGPIEALIGFA